ncbi:DUF7347 domain-containing protein [Halobacterium zhouii]|uniref:DUF7347 domain-containing protein n=1 Tax=Halobacterium zhouii TaxID=2902624 RepID=UPI001E4DB2DC|nr:hypothetical protein [Halobacterium zhouii]
MTESNRRDDALRGPAEALSISATGGVDDAVDYRTGGEMAPSEAFKTLASEVRVAVLVSLLRAERSSDDPLSFSELQSTVGSDSSAGFAYHLRQLSGHFVRKEADGYVLTAAGRRAAAAVLEGTFTTSGDQRAS